MKTKRNLKEIKTTIQQTSTGKLVLRLSINSEDMTDLLLEDGKQPKGLFNSIIITRRNNLRDKYII